MSLAFIACKFLSALNTWILVDFFGYLLYFMTKTYTTTDLVSKQGICVTYGITIG
jgi:hypothetical protein